MNPRIILYAALVLAVFDYAHRSDPPQQLPLVKADFPVCVTLNPGTIEPRVNGTDPHPRRKDVA